MNGHTGVDSDEEHEQQLLSLDRLDEADHQNDDDRGHAKLSDFNFSPVELRLITDAGPGCGGHLWPSAVVLAKYLKHLVETDPHRWRNKTCIELGAGTGVVAIALATFDVPGLEIYSTDLLELLPLARLNVKANGLEGRVAVKELEWGKDIPDDVPVKPDLLLLADCIYLESTFPLLVDAMRKLMTKDTEVLLCYKKRRKADKRFFAIAKKYFTFTDIVDDPNRPSYDREGLHLYSVSLRR